MFQAQINLQPVIENGKHLSVVTGVSEIFFHQRQDGLQQRKIVAITNSRLVQLEGEEVTFTWKDYADQDRIREMTLSGEEFLRRFLLHVLPDRFVRIRYYGLLANRHRKKALALCREVPPGPPARPKPLKSDWRDRLPSLTGIDPMRCEVCGQKVLRLVGQVAPARAPRAPPR